MYQQNSLPDSKLIHKELRGFEGNLGPLWSQYIKVIFTNLFWLVSLTEMTFV